MNENNKDEINKDENPELADSFFWIGSEDEEPEVPQGYQRFQMTLDNFQDWNESIMSQLHEKTYILYFMPLDNLFDSIKNITLDFLPLSEFIHKDKFFKLKDELAFRESLSQLIPNLRQNTDKPLVYEDFSTIFKESAKDDINFELIYYFQILQTSDFSNKQNT